MQNVHIHHVKYTVANPCIRCAGSGRRSYGSTATWGGGIGGQTITEDVCDRCLGTGTRDKQGANLKMIDAEFSKIRTAERLLEEIVERYDTEPIDIEELDKVLSLLRRKSSYET